MARGGHVKGAGADAADLTRASKPTAPTYKYPLAKGLGALRPKLAPDGSEAPLTGYGRGGAVPSSVSVNDSVALADLDIAPKGGDAVLAALQDDGFGDRSETGARIDDLQRKVSTDMLPATFGHHNPNASPVQVPAKTGASNAQPVRKPA